MNAKIKTRWIEALRSGRYEQTVGLLRGRYGFCALGVLCDIAPGSHYWEKGYGGDWNFMSAASGSRMFLAGLGLTLNEQETIGKMNDNDRASFHAIADYIEVML